MASLELKREIQEALKNTTLSRTLGTFCATYPAKREKSYAGVDFESTRDSIKEVKSYAAEHVDEMIEEFTKNCTARGGNVFHAHSTEEAMEYIRNLVKEKGVKTIVKSKSMASEELHMNHVLGDDGVLVQETDLGEFIIALEGNTPVHMVMPALHLNKEQVAEYFTEYTKVKNYVFGIEKFVKSLSDARYIFKALPRNGTGQRITSYICMYTGATEVTTDKEADTKEKKEFYAVILDDPGRRAILADPDFREVYNCIRCGACLDVCPAFALLGGHVYGSKVYTGGIGTILTHFLVSEERADEIQNICLQCGRCKEVCGGGLHIPEMIMKLRERSYEANPNPVYKFALDAVSDRKLFHSMLRIASVAQEPFTKGTNFIRHLPMFLSGMTEGRSLMSIAPVPFRDIFPTIQQKVDNPKGKIAMFTGCMLDFAYVDIAKAVIANLNSIGYVVDMPMGQSCCGAPATYMGDRENAKKTAELNVEAMHAEDYDYVVSACPTCTHQLREYRTFFEEGSDMYKKAAELGDKTFDFCKLFYDLGGLEESGDASPITITYHDSCHLRRELGVWKEQRELLTKTNGITLVEMVDSDVCCGFGGTYSIKLPEVATPILANKLAHIKDTGASLVAVDCPGCLMQIRGGMDANDIPIEVKHTAVILAEKRGLI